MDRRIAVLTNDNHLWALRPFLQQFDKYWRGDGLYIYGFNQPDFAMPPRYQFESLGEQRGVDSWSIALLDMLDRLPELFILFLEDFWLAERVNRTAVVDAMDYMEQDDKILRFDLTRDRASFPHKKFRQGRHEFVESTSDANYLMSFQTGIWRKSMLKEIVGSRLETPWDLEIAGSFRVRKKMREEGWRICGFTNPPIVYAPCVRTRNGDQIIQSKQWGKLSKEDQYAVRPLIPKRIRFE